MRRCVVVIEPVGDNYSAYVPDLPGCVATGETVDEALANMRTAIIVHLKGMREDGLVIPEPSSTTRYIDVAQ